MANRIPNAAYASSWLGPEARASGDSVSRCPLPSNGATARSAFCGLPCIPPVTIGSSFRWRAAAFPIPEPTVVTEVHGRLVPGLQFLPYLGINYLQGKPRCFRRDVLGSRLALGGA